MGGLALGVDIGGTKIVAGLVGSDGTVVVRSRSATPDDAKAIAPLVAAEAGKLLAQAGVDDVPVGVGAAGLIDPDGVVRYAPNIAWASYPLRAELERLLGIGVTVDNDANVAAWGEYRCGAGSAARTSLVVLTIGTGVGGGLVINDSLVRGASGMGAELGHTIVDEGGAECPCGNRGCLEAMASGTAIGLAATTGLEDPAVESVLRGSGPVTGKQVTLAAFAGDRFARQVLRRCGFWLGVGIASLVNALDPEMVVVGGGAMEAGELLLEPAREAAAARLLGREHRDLPPVVRATLADDAGMVGAGLLALGDRA